MTKHRPHITWTCLHRRDAWNHFNFNIQPLRVILFSLFTVGKPILSVWVWVMSMLSLESSILCDFTAGKHSWSFEWHKQNFIKTARRKFLIMIESSIVCKLRIVKESFHLILIKQLLLILHRKGVSNEQCKLCFILILMSSKMFPGKILHHPFISHHITHNDKP